MSTQFFDESVAGELDCARDGLLNVLPSRFPGEEFANTLTHGAGLVLSLAGALPLQVTTAHQPNWSIRAGCFVYLLTMVGVYAASTLSHAVQHPLWKHRLRALDQACIYLFIAGTYTPIALAYMNSGWWWLLTALMWTVALVGFVSKVLLKHQVQAVCISAYLLLGWMPIVAIRPMVELLPTACLAMFVAGGLCYTVGTIFLTMDTRVPFFHSVWHILVIAGSACHYAAILLYAAPAHESLRKLAELVVQMPSVA